MNKRAILIDFDNTLTKTDTIKFLLLSLFLSDPLLGMILFKRFFGKIKDQAVIKRNVIGSFVNGKTVMRVSSALRLYRFLIRMSIRKTIMGKIKTCEQIVVIASASPSFALKTLEELSGVNVIATDFEVVNGKYTGNLNGAICFGDEKLKRVGKFTKEEGIDEITEAYTDHFSDFPMLSLAQKKYLVNPDYQTKLNATSDMIIMEL